MKKKKTAGSMVRGTLSPGLLGLKGFMIFKLGQFIQEKTENYFNEHKIKPRHYLVLALLREKGALSQQQLCEGLWIDRATMVGVIQKLTRLGFVRKRSHPGDKRAHLVSLTPKGTEFHAAHEAAFRQLDTEAFFPSLSKEDHAKLLAILQKSVKSLERG
ncbi:MAG: MarR family transcriptional regulator [Bdellovibrionaceae bacterium]|nr:MarR family transcriptional regulator [Pseudobdellovibrionaceae bacterium]MBX3032482.1 MarR family transcriptional regulator [Pseudobdellovibrionaceae bacterium]